MWACTSGTTSKVWRKNACDLVGPAARVWRLGGQNGLDAGGELRAAAGVHHPLRVQAAAARSLDGVVGAVDEVLDVEPRRLADLVGELLADAVDGAQDLIADVLARTRRSP